MRIFVTGASGFVGSAVVREALRAGHQVVGLARSDAAAKAITDAGAIAYLGDLESPESLQRGASEADAIVHTGFNHDFSQFKAKCENDRKAIDALGSALLGSNRPLVVTSALGVLPQGSVSEQTMPLSPSPNPRAATEEAVRALLDRGVNVSVVRLPPSTHGEGDHGFVPMLIGMARDKRVSAYIGEGENRWPAIHRIDAAKVYLRALERSTPGAYYHAVAEEGVPFREIAEVIGRRLSIPVVSKSPGDEAAAHFTWFAYFAAMNLTASSLQTQEQLRWQPTMPGLVADVDQPYYFA